MPRIDLESLAIKHGKDTSVDGTNNTNALHQLTPLRLEFMATTVDQELLMGLYFSTVFSSVVSSLPPTAYNMS